MLRSKFNSEIEEAQCVHDNFGDIIKYLFEACDMKSASFAAINIAVMQQVALAALCMPPKLEACS